MRRRDSGITLVEILAALTVLGIVVALVVPALNHSARFDTVLLCRQHLKTLHEAQSKAPSPGAKQLGRFYWTRLADAQPPLVAADAMRCPFVSLPDAPRCQYLGPSSDPEKLEAKDPLGCDMENNHSDTGKEGGNVLLKSGEVVTDHTGIWATAARQGKCSP